MVHASKLIERLTELIKERGDLPVMVGLVDDGTYDINMPKYDTDGAGDDCYII